MIKEIKISEEKTLKINSASGWLFIYKSQFGHDILPDILPVLQTVLGALADLAGRIEEKDDIKEILRKIDPDALDEALIHMAAFESTTIISILWAMAKNAGEDVPTPETWANEFDNFPLDVILPELLDVLAASFISEKNLKSLKETAKSE